MKYIFAILLLSVSLIFGFSGILNNLQNRAIHADESEQASTFLKLYETGEYKYNPNGPHGPTLYYWANCALKLTGNQPADSIEMKSLRMAMLPIMIMAIALIFMLTADIGLCACMCSASAFISTSLAQIYGTYFVQEIIFAVFIFATTASAWRFIKAPSIKNAIWLGLTAGFAQATKETSVIAYVSIILSILITALVNVGIKNKLKECSFKNFAKQIGICAVVFIVVCCAWYSSFGSNWQGIVDAFKSYYIHFFDKAGNSNHAGETLFYVKLLLVQKSQGAYFGEAFFSALALIGFVISIFNARKNTCDACVMFFGANAIITIIILSSITYKTPWLILSPVMLFSVCAGYALYKIFSMPVKFSIPVIAILVGIYWYYQYPNTNMAVKRFHSDSRNPFIYAHTVADAQRLHEFIVKASEFSKYKKQMPVAFVCNASVSPWPMPWLLRNLENTGYYNNIPENIKIFEIIAFDSHSAIEVSKKINLDEYNGDIFGLRDGTTITVLVKNHIWNEMFK